MPVNAWCCIVNNKFLAVHGGISPELKTLQDIQNLNRNKETPRSGLLCDLLWSDPVDNDTGESFEKFKANDVRSCSFYYGASAVRILLQNVFLVVLNSLQSLQKLKPKTIYSI